ncbi:unnamed protein product [Caretta caretta]
MGGICYPGTAKGGGGEEKNREQAHGVATRGGKGKRDPCRRERGKSDKAVGTWAGGLTSATKQAEDWAVFNKEESGGVTPPPRTYCRSRTSGSVALGKEEQSLETERKDPR